MRQLTHTWECPKCLKVERQPRTANAVAHACPKVQGSKYTWFRRVK